MALQDVPPIRTAGTTDTSLTANTALACDANKKVVSSSTTDTELGYLHGVTGPIQAQIDGISGSGVKTYAAVMSQFSNDPPIVDTLLYNNLSGAIVWTYDGEGSYIGTLAGAFPANKVAETSGFINWENDTVWKLRRVDNNTINLVVGTQSLGLSDSILTSTLIRFEVYP